MKATQIAYSANLNKGKYDELVKQAQLLGQVRSEVWRSYGSIKGVGVQDRSIRNTWLKEKRAFAPLAANAWKETLRDTFDDINLYQEAAKVNARKSVRRHTSDNVEQKRLYTLLKSNKWPEDKYLTRIMRKYYKHGQTHVRNQIIVRSDNYTTFQKSGKAWLSIPSLVKGKRITIPTTSNIEPTGTLRILLMDGVVEIHYTVEVAVVNDCGNATVGIDKGYTEVFVASDGVHYGTGLGTVLSTESDWLKKKNQSRNKLYQIAQKSNPKKKSRIQRNNLGRKKLNVRSVKTKNQIRTLVFNATHALVDNAKTIIAEDLSAPITKKNRSFGRNINRRLSAWTKGVISEALNSVSQRRSSSLQLVNAAYTSQIDHQTGCFTGTRKGDRFHCENGAVYHADENAAKNVEARINDPEIGQWTSYKTVKAILLRRTDSYRLGLLNLGTSYKQSRLLTVRELPSA